MLETTVDVTCPHCWENITLFVDLSVAEQTYVEDCSVCCNPMTVSIRCADGDLVSAEVTALE